MPVVSGLSLAAASEIVLNLAKVTDEPPYHLKTLCEFTAFGAGFLIAMKIKEYIAIVSTAFFGAFTCTMAGSILFDVVPGKNLKYKNGKLSMTNAQLVQMYMPYLVSILILMILGTVYQNEQMKDTMRIAA